jgi:hypothetical protein
MLFVPQATERSVGNTLLPRGAHPGPARADPELSRKPKVCQHRSTAVLQQHVVWLEVQHDDAARVQLRQARQDVAAVPAGRRHVPCCMSRPGSWHQSCMAVLKCVTCREGQGLGPVQGFACAQRHP